MAEGILSEEDVEKFLNENPELARKYFVQCAQSGWIDEWLGRRSQRPSIQPIQSIQKVSTSSSDSILKPLRNCYPVSKSPTSRSKLQKLYGSYGSDTESEDEDDDLQNKRTISPLNVPDLDSLSEKDLFMQLIRDIADELDINKLSHKILVNVSLLTKGDRCSLFLIKGESSRRYLVSRLFDVTSTSTLEQSLKPEGSEIIIPVGIGIAGTTALTGEVINIKEAYEDPRFNDEVDRQTGYRTHSILCMPIKSPDGMIIGIAQVINKQSGDHQFTEKDAEVFRDYLTFCGIGITNAQLFDLSVQEFKRNQALLSLARGIFETTEVVEDVVRGIMTQARQLLDCERCTVYLVDTEDNGSEDITFEQVFDLHSDGDNQQSTESSDGSNIYQRLAMHVVASQEAINIVDLDKAASEYNLEMNACFLAAKYLKSMLCTPIFNKESKVIGVAQLMNKQNGHPFTENDDGLFQAFATFCGLGIYNAQMYEKMYRLHTQQALSIELLSYHASASLEEAKRLQAMEVPEKGKLRLTSFDLDDLSLSDDETCLAAVRMFLDLDLLSKFKVPYKVLCRWILTVRKNYRPVTYHNWRHGFNVAQTMYAIFTSGAMVDEFSDMEIFVLLIACFCHDLDHRGTNNSFQAKADSPISRLYSTSTMEHHHFDQSLMILNSEVNNIFAALSHSEYKEALTILEHAILSTDLAIYFKKRDEFRNLVQAKECDWRRDKNRKILRAMMMTACDLSAITKPWPIQRRVAEMVASEFFEQGDMERSQLQQEPTPMMDRRKKDELPKMQVGFIDFVCLPLYELLPELNEKLKPLLDGIQTNKLEWKKMAEESAVVCTESVEKNKASKMPAETTEDGIERGRQGRKETDDDIVGRNSDFKKHVPVAESLPTKYNSKTKKQYGSAVCILL